MSSLFWSLLHDSIYSICEQSGGAPDKRLAETQKALESAEKELEKAKEESSRSVAETERLLQLMRMTQEEQNSKEKQIRELQEWVALNTLNAMQEINARKLVIINLFVIRYMP